MQLPAPSEHQTQFAILTHRTILCGSDEVSGARFTIAARSDGWFVYVATGQGWSDVGSERTEEDAKAAVMAAILGRKAG